MLKCIKKRAHTHTIDIKLCHVEHKMVYTRNEFEPGFVCEELNAHQKCHSLENIILRKNYNEN